MIFRQLFFITCLFLFLAANAKIKIVSPKNNSAQLNKNLTLIFNPNVYSRNYTVQIATSNTFSADKIESTVITTNNILNKNLFTNQRFIIFSDCSFRRFVKNNNYVVQCYKVLTIS